MKCLHIEKDRATALSELFLYNYIWWLSCFLKKTRLTNDYQWRTLHGVLFAHQLLHVDLNRIRAAACQMLRFRAGRTTRSRIWSTVRACELRRCGKHAVYVFSLHSINLPIFGPEPLFLPCIHCSSCLSSSQLPHLVVGPYLVVPSALLDLISINLSRIFPFPICHYVLCSFLLKCIHIYHICSIFFRKCYNSDKRVFPKIWLGP